MIDFWASCAGLSTKALQLLPPEAAHHMGMQILAMNPTRFLRPCALDHLDASLRVQVPGLGNLPHPIGLAAGFDKNGIAIKGLAGLGFSHIEIGAVTPRSQPGNVRPRLFRYRSDRSLINRMGFNNDGAAQISARIGSQFWSNDICPLGVNIGKNKDTPAEKALDDFLQVHAVFSDLARFFVINLSSPNTPGLRKLATPEFMAEIARSFGPEIKKMWIKFDPDMDRNSFQKLVEEAGNAGWAGMVLTNSQRVEAPESGGLSGRPLFERSNQFLDWAWEVHRGKIPMIGVGGIFSGLDVLEKITRGANAVQIYTAFAYRGPWVVANLLQELAAELPRRGFSSLAEARGSQFA